MSKLIEYFITNKRLNYMIVLFLLYLGYNAYVNIPKEIFPSVELDKIAISGNYSGASATNMDKMAVRDIESALSNISGVEQTDTIITPGVFNILLTLSEDANKINTLNKVKDAIASTRQYLPSDMVEPTATLMDRNRPLIRLAVSSETLSQGELTRLVQELKTKLSMVRNISEISIRGDSDEEVSIEINHQALLAYGINPASAVSAISSLSYIFPVGDIEERGNFVFVSTVSGKANTQEYKDAVLNIDGSYVRLGDIAKVQVYYPQTNTLSTFNNEKAITLVIKKSEAGNSIKLSQELREYVEKISLQYQDVNFNFYQDTSKRVKQRLDTVISNLMFGLVLVFISMYVLINLRIAIIVAVGIPFSFIIGLLFIYHMGYSINIVSLLGALIVIGIVVDDAIVVSENIQRHIDEGMDVKEASIVGMKEMILPVSLATITTAAAFLPMFLMKGEIALFLILVPIVVVMILLGSLIESFFFLPLHAQELLKKSKPMVNWQPLQEWYMKVLSFHIEYKKLFLVTFIILIPVLTVFTAKSMKFQFFPNFDGEYLYITGKLDINTPIEDTFEIAKEIEATMMQHSEEFALKSITATSGWRRSLSGETQRGNNVFYITMEMADRKQHDFINAYINPVLNFSFDFEQADATREKKSFELSPRAKEIIEPFREKYKMEELGVMESKPGLIRSDIQVNLSGSNDALLEDGIKKIESKLKEIEGVLNFSDNIRYGKMEYKLKVNSYGEQLGLSEAYIAKTLSAYFLQRKQATTFNETGVVEIKTQHLRKDESNALLAFNLPLLDGRFVRLSEVVEIQKIRDYEKIDKLNGNIVKSVFANVDKRIITAGEVLQILEPILEEIKSSGVAVNLLGEKEKNAQLKSDMKNAVILAIFLILITLLLIFSKIKYALMVMSVIPLSILGALIGHKLMGMNLAMPSIIGILGLAGVVINDGIIMLDFLHGTHKKEEFFERAKLRLRPIIITSVTTFLGLFSLIFYAAGQAVILQPIAISIGFGLLWGTVLNLIYLPTLYALVNGIEPMKRK
jgi:HAE1 family hydrophobic/amphiphilic exporter-1